ncbi:MAG: flagellar hook-basal body complex protein FliE [Filomicrobium sp.]
MIDAISGIAGPGAVKETNDAMGAGAANAVASPVDADSFSHALESALTDAIGKLRNAEQVSISGVAGQASAQEVVEAVMEAQQKLQTAIAVRNKVVEAYLEVSRMQI